MSYLSTPTCLCCWAWIGHASSAGATLHWDNAKNYCPECWEGINLSNGHCNYCQEKEAYTREQEEYDLQLRLRGDDYWKTKIFRLRSRIPENVLGDLRFAFRREPRDG